jgi:hypothetical protein
MPGKVNPISNRREALGIKAFSWFHHIVYNLTAGRLLGVVAGAPVLLLTTTGHWTRKQRTKPLLYLMEDDGYVVVASYAGRPSNPALAQKVGPAWLESNPRPLPQRGKVQARFRHSVPTWTTGQVKGYLSKVQRYEGRVN